MALWPVGTGRRGAGGGGRAGGWRGARQLVNDAQTEVGLSLHDVLDTDVHHLRVGGPSSAQPAWSLRRSLHWAWEAIERCRECLQRLRLPIAMPCSPQCREPAAQSAAAE